MSDTKKVFILLTLFFDLLLICKSSEVKEYTNLEMLYEDPLVYESWTFAREYYYNSPYVDNDKEICYQIGNMKIIIYTLNMSLPPKIIKI